MLRLSEVGVCFCRGCVVMWNLSRGSEISVNLFLSYMSLIMA